MREGVAGLLREKMWDAAAASGLPVHFHTIGSGVAATSTKLAPKVALAARITSFQMYMSEVLLSVIFSGVLEHHPGIKPVIGKATRLRDLPTGGQC